MKKGFTIVELLATIIILSVILVIAIPKIQNVINDTKKETFSKDINTVIAEIKRVYQNNYAGSISTNFQTYTADNGTWTNDEEVLNIFDNKKELTGTVKIDSDGNVSLALHNNTYCAVKLINSTEVDVMDFHSSCGLPNIYQQVEYIESTGTQYIDTGYVPNVNYKNFYIKTKIMWDSTKIGTRQLMGNYSSTSGYWGVNTLGNYEIFDDSGIAVSTDSYDEVIHALIGNKSKLIVNNAMVLNKGYSLNDSPGEWPSDNTYLIFSLIDNYKASLKLKYFKAYDNDILIRNMIPCYRISDNTIGMYDLVNNEFYTNDGTGTFLKGSNV